MDLLKPTRTSMPKHEQNNSFNYKNHTSRPKNADQPHKRPKPASIKRVTLDSLRADRGAAPELDEHLFIYLKRETKKLHEHQAGLL